VHREFRAPEWDTLRMDYQNPFLELEPLEREIAIVDDALNVMKEVGAIPHIDYPHDKLLAHRKAVAEEFEIPWTAITPRMQRFIYALNAITKPANMIAAGVFCGNTFISNAGAGVGPGACYTAENLIGVEIKPEEAERAERNVRKIDPTGVARVVAEDGIEVCRDFEKPVNLLYLDADGTPEQGKGVYLNILEACYTDMPKGSLVLAHNSYNSAEKLVHYLAYVRDDANFSASVNVLLDGEGLEVSVK
jgi:predicted O-methyltransferase YrrM